MPPRKLVVIATITATVLGLNVWAVAYLLGPKGCDELDSAKNLRAAVSAKYAPPLDHVDVEGWCDDETAFYGVDARLGSDLADAERTLSKFGCRATQQAPPAASLDFIERAAARMRCDVPGFGPALVSLQPHGPLLSEWNHAGVRGFFAPLDADT